MKYLYLLLLLSSAALCGCASESVLLHPETGKPVPYGGKFSATPVKVPKYYAPKPGEMRGVWVATVEQIDFPMHQDAASFQRDYIAIVNNLKRHHFNTIIFQVRPMNDAFYLSRLNPWSRWMTGQEGRGFANFDPLAFMISEAHKRGLEFHAWLNPYRVINSTPKRKAEYLKTLAPNNFAARHPHLVLESKRKDGTWSLILNPAEPRVVRHISETVREIMEKYPVDAIHFDDYFYPYGGVGDADASSFKQMNPRKLSLDDWRRNNVDNTIRSVRQTINAFNRQTGRKVRFGISPFGIWANQKTHPEGSLSGGLQSYYSQYADTRGWVKKGWIDYIVPQLYWPFCMEVAPYAALTDWWAAQVRGTGVDLYIGHGAYQLGSSGKWRVNEITDQLRYNCKHREIKGSVFFSYRNLFNPTNEVMKTATGQMLRNYYTAPTR